jgi:hypothetical protein
MAEYLIAFPSATMVVPDGESEAVDRDAHAHLGGARPGGNVMRQAQPRTTGVGS